jgi:indolepyruvate ferredoxin oxidoreductase
VAAGKTYYDLRQALHEVGLDDDKLRQTGIRLLKIGMLFPMEPEVIYEFADGLEEVFVIEEKRSFIEMFIREILYDKTERPRVVGKHDEHGNRLVKPYGELDSDQIVRVLAKRLSQRISLDSMDARLDIIQTPPEIGVIPLSPRSPFYCSGCPHNSSTVALMTHSSPRE